MLKRSAKEVCLFVQKDLKTLRQWYFVQRNVCCIHLRYSLNSPFTYSLCSSCLKSIDLDVCSSESLYPGENTFHHFSFKEQLSDESPFIVATQNTPILSGFQSFEISYSITGFIIMKNLYQFVCGMYPSFYYLFHLKDCIGIQRSILLSFEDLAFQFIIFYGIPSKPLSHAGCASSNYAAGSF